MTENGNPGSLAAARAPNTFSLLAERSEDNPVLAALQVHAGPSPEAMAECDEFILDEIYRDFDLIESYAISGKEAVRRGDHDEVRLRLRCQLRDVFRHAVQIHDLLSIEPSKRGGS
jgi:hypothetical protein